MVITPSNNVIIYPRIIMAGVSYTRSVFPVITSPLLFLWRQTCLTSLEPVGWWSVEWGAIIDTQQSCDSSRCVWLRKQKRKWWRGLRVPWVNHRSSKFSLHHMLCYYVPSGTQQLQSQHNCLRSPPSLPRPTSRSVTCAFKQATFFCVLLKIRSALP